MKTMLVFSILAALLGGCAIVPVGYGDNHDGYYQERGHRSDGNYRDRNYYRHDGNYRDHGYGGEYRNPGDPFREHGG